MWLFLEAITTNSAHICLGSNALSPEVWRAATDGLLGSMHTAWLYIIYRCEARTHCVQRIS
jgi:hypothetical protein